MGSFKDVFSPIQLAVLNALPPEPSTFLSGAGALSGHYLGHRSSRDLDFFCTSLEGVAVIAAALASAGAVQGWTVERKQDTPAFLRFKVTHGNQSTLVDVVHEPVPQVVAVDKKPLVANVRVDAIEDLIANKLGALSRLETKDLVDLYFLKQAGFDALAHLPAAKTKDGGLDAAMLAHVVSQIPVDPARLLMIKPIAAADLQSFRDDLVERLLKLASDEARAAAPK